MRGAEGPSSRETGREREGEGAGPCTEETGDRGDLGPPEEVNWAPPRR